MNPFMLTNVIVHAEEETYPKGYVLVKDGQIAETGPMQAYKGDAVKTIQLPEDCQVIPGAVDIHIHGAAGCDAMDAVPESLKKMAEVLPAEGTTSFFATTMTQSPQAVEAALKNAGEYIRDQEPGIAEITGIHLEGPFISPKRKGAQPETFIRTPDISLFEKWQRAADGRIKLVTLAPEQNGGLEFASYLKEHGIIASIGHSDALYEEVEEAVKAGISHVTHLYNGMRGLHHREPGVLGAAYLLEELMVELIADGIHCRPEMVKLAYNQIGSSRLIMITDSLRGKWMKDGIYDLGGQQVSVNGKTATLEDGTLAGSILKMNDAIKNVLAFTGCSMRDIIRMTAENPSREAGLDHRKGSIRKGKDADLVVLNKGLDVEMTFCRGRLAYQKGALQ